MTTKKLPIVVAHYTINTGYENEVEKLIASLERWSLRYDIEAIETKGTWRKNSNYCTENVQKMMKRYPNDDILRVDADAVFQRFPSILIDDKFDADVAAHVHDFRWNHNELMGGTLYFKNTPTVRNLVDYWCLLALVDKPQGRPGDLLQEIINSNKFDIKFVELPDTYCKIFDIMGNVREPVIEHFQASRRLKRRVNIKGLKGRK